MSIFSESVVKFKGDTILLVSVSHNLINPSVAVCVSNKIMLYSDNGDKYDYELARNISPTAIDWHPT
jgi:intraflagellar transport protein 140